jgi:protein SCO1/2
MASARVRFRSIGWPILAVAAAVSCARPEPEPRQFEMRGQILALRSDSEVLVQHDDIKGFMPAMTMPYRVRDPQLLRDKAAGDLISATIAVSDTDAWLTRLDKTGAAPLPPEARALSPAATVAPLRTGDRAPATTLTAANGAPLSLPDYRGSVVAVTFIYTRCPLPQYCPLLDRRFAEAQRAVKDDRALSGRVHLLSISFDPDADTPAALQAHARKLQADPQIWRFATAPRDEVDRFAAAFGVNVMRENDSTITHNMRTALVDPSGLVAAIYDGTDWTVEQLVADMRRVLNPR